MSTAYRPAFQLQQPPAPPQYAESPPQTPRKGFNKALLLIPVVAVIAVIALFIYLFGYGRQSPPPGSMLIDTEQKALQAARANFTYFPESIASINADEQGDFWYVNVMIPGQRMMNVTIRKSDGALAIEKSVLYFMPIISIEDAREIGKYMLGSGSKEMTVISSGDYWFIQPASENVYFKIEKSTGMTWTGYGVYNESG